MPFKHGIAWVTAFLQQPEALVPLGDAARVLDPPDDKIADLAHVLHREAHALTAQP
jgi:hypothetical protein